MSNWFRVSLNNSWFCAKVPELLKTVDELYTAAVWCLFASLLFSLLKVGMCVREREEGGWEWGVCRELWKPHFLFREVYKCAFFSLSLIKESNFQMCFSASSDYTSEGRFMFVCLCYYMSAF